MHRCQYESMKCADATRRVEMTVQELASHQPMVLADVVVDAGPGLFSLLTPEQLNETTARYSHRLSRREFQAYVELMEERYGTAFARRAGLPVGRPRLRLAG